MINPYYQDEWVTIYHADCRQVLGELEGDALVTDPPYGIGWSRGSWDDDPAEYDALMHWLVAEAVRIGGWSFIFQAMLNVGHFNRWFPNGWRIFAACKNFTQIRDQRVWHSFDPVVFWNNGTGNNHAKQGCVNRDFFISNVAGVFNNKIAHPCPRQLDVMRYIVNLASDAGVIIDPFMGSGTTLRAAKDLGIKAIGIEIEEKYCEIAAERMRQQALSFDAPALPTQPILVEV